MSEPLLTAAMIVRDEEAHLAACLESIREVVDEIVIVDTGSQDASVAIARSFGAVVHEQPWRGDFAQARNAGLDLARGRWILYIDADERLRPIAPEAVRSRLRDASEVALRVRLRPVSTATPYWEYRLWRSDPRIRFVRSMHEKVTMAIQAVAHADARTIGESEMFLEHVGYDGDQMHKHRRNLPLLRAQLAAEPADPYSWHHLARVLDALGEPEQSQDALEQALRTARETGATTGVLAFLESIHRRREAGQDTGGVLQAALARYPDNFALHWLAVIDEIDAGRYEQALRRLERFDVDDEMPLEDTSAYPRELVGARAAEARAICLFKLGRDAEAAVAFGRAEALEPEQPAHRVKRVLAESRAARRAPAAAGDPAPSGLGRYLWAAPAPLAGATIDVGGVPVGLSATDAVRAAAIRDLLGRLAPSDRDPLVRLRFSAHRPPTPDRVPDGRVGEFDLWHDGDALAIAYGNNVAGSVAVGHATLGGYAANLGEVFRHMAPFMLASLLGPHECFLLHGGAIHRDGVTLLVLGGTGSGKSTLVWAALQHGWSVLADDLVVVSVNPAGPVVTGVPKSLAVPIEVLAAPAGDPVSPTDPRARTELSFEAWDRAPRPVTGVLVPGHGDGSAATIAPIERPELLGTVVHSLLVQQPSLIRRVFSLAVALSERPAARLLHARAAEHRVAQAGAVLSAWPAA